MAEIEFSVLARTCLRGRNADENRLEAQSAPVCQNGTRQGPLLTGDSLPKTPGANSTVYTPANPELFQY